MGPINLSLVIMPPLSQVLEHHHFKTDIIHFLLTASVLFDFLGIHSSNCKDTVETPGVCISEALKDM